MLKFVNIIFEDSEILVLDKAAGILSIPDRYNKSLPNLFTELNSQYQKIFTVHRLDRETSGIMLFAKNAESHKNLNTQFQEQRVRKIYHLVLNGTLSEDEIKIDIPLISNPRKKGMMMPSINGKKSLTILRVLKKFRNATLAECELVSGRHHQIRAHCAAIGNPLIVDSLYGTATEFMLSSIKRRYNLKKHDTEKPLLSRVSMHAYEIGFTHPTSGEFLSFKTEYPKDFAALVKVLSKYSSV